MFHTNTFETTFTKLIGAMILAAFIATVLA